TAGGGDIEAYLEGDHHTRITGASDWTKLSTKEIHPDGEDELADATSSDLSRTVDTAPRPYKRDGHELRAGEDDGPHGGGKRRRRSGAPHRGRRVPDRTERGRGHRSPVRRGPAALARGERVVAGHEPGCGRRRRAARGRGPRPGRARPRRRDPGRGGRGPDRRRDPRRRRPHRADRRRRRRGPAMTRHDQHAGARKELTMSTRPVGRRGLFLGAGGLLAAGLLAACGEEVEPPPAPPTGKELAEP